MSRTSLWHPFIVIAAGLVLAVTFSSGARAAAADNSGGGALAASMLHDGDLPTGFQPYEPLTGPLDGQRAQALRIDLSQFGPQSGSVRDWVSPHTGDEVIETGIDAGTRDVAEASLAATTSGLLKQGLVRQTVGGQVRFDAFSTFVELDGVRYFVLALPLARGPYDFGLLVYVPASAAASASTLMSSLATTQIRRVPANTPDTEPADNLAPDAAGGTVGVLVGYLLIVDGIAYLRNPLRRKLTRGRPTRPQPGPGVIDVSAAAKKNKRTAVWRLAVQLTGLAIAALGVDVSRVSYWYAYLVIGLAIVWAGGRFIHTAGARRAQNRAILAGSHKVLVTGMLAVASAMILLGFACAVVYGVYQALPQGDR